MTEKGPDRIWVRLSDGRFSWLMSTHEITGATEYVRADLAGWQPIDTAPRDGREFLARVMDRYPFSTAPEYRWDIARWSGKTSDSVTGHFQSRSGSIVTNWMPIPAPPEATL